jgi:hypothetical protein
MEARLALRIAAALTLLAPLLCACGATGPVVAHLPSLDEAQESRCGIVKDHSRPLIVEWPASARGDLAVRMKSGLVAVRYIGCAMEVLDTCTVSGAYRYVAFSPKEDRLAIYDIQDLHANLPMGAAGLEAKLLAKGELDLGMTVVGKYQSDKLAFRPADLHGDCAAATHVVTGMTAGAFELSAGGKTEASGKVSFFNARAAGRSVDARETLSRDGSTNACGASAEEDTQPPRSCSAILRVEVVPLNVPACPPGSQRDGERCVPERVVMQVDCPGRTIWDGERCVAERMVVTNVECPEGATWNGAICEGRSKPSTATPGPSMAMPKDPMHLFDVARAYEHDPPFVSRVPPPPPCDGSSEAECVRRCDSGSAPSCLLIARRSEKLEGTRRAVAVHNAVVWFLAACMNGAGEGCAGVGRAYEEGRLGEGDALSAIKWYRKACGLADGEGCSALQRLKDR